MPPTPTILADHEDGRRLGLMRGKTHLESQGFGAEADRYQAVLKANATELSVEEAG